MSKIIAVIAFVFVLAQGHGFGSALVGGIGAWLILRFVLPWMLKPVRIERYDWFGNRIGD